MDNQPRFFVIKTVFEYSGGVKLICDSIKQIPTYIYKISEQRILFFKLNYKHTLDGFALSKFAYKVLKVNHTATNKFVNLYRLPTLNLPRFKIFKSFLLAHVTNFEDTPMS